MSVRRKTIERELAALKQRYAGEFDTAVSEISRTGGSSLACACLFSWCCQSKRSLVQLQRAHHLAARHGHLQHAYVGNMLLQAYRRYGDPLLAKAVFSTLPNKDVFTWTIMVAAFAQNGHHRDAVQVFRSMELHGVKPSNVTYVSVLSAVSSWEFVQLGKMIHERVRSLGGEADVIVGTAVISMYGRCGSLDDARVVFERMPERNLITWTALITACAQHGREAHAVELYQKLHEQGMFPDAVTFISVLDACTSLGDVEIGREVHKSIPDHLLSSNTALGNALINMYVKCGAVEEARLVFDMTLTRNLSTWNCMLTGYAKQRLARETLELFNDMDVKPDHVTYLSLVSACMQLGDVSAGCELYRRIREETECIHNEALCHALMNMFSKFGKPDKVSDIFSKMSSRNVISWTSVVAGFAHNGRTDDTRFMFRSMRLEGVTPDSIAFVTLLFSCNHGGLLEPCVEVYRCMVEEYGLSPRIEHLTCVVDVLARSGKLDEAEEFIMASDCGAAVLWNTLLSSCKTHRDVVRGRRAAERVFELEPHSWPAYVMLSNIHAEAGQWNESLAVRARMNTLKAHLLG